MSKMLLPVLLGVLLVTAFPGDASADTMYDLKSHPDGNQNPPPYGLRLDNLFSGLGNSGVTTFDFDPSSGAAMTLTVRDDSGPINIEIKGTAYGGIDTGSGYGFGAGLYTIDFTYSANVAAVSDGWQVSPQSISNFGTITAGAGITGVTEGTAFTFYEQTGTNNPFKFVTDDHRLSGHTEAGQGYHVGRGWVTFNSDGSNSSGTQDWLFLGENPRVPPDLQTVPLPTAAWAGLGLLGALGGLRRARRRKQARQAC